MRSEESLKDYSSYKDIAIYLKKAVEDLPNGQLISVGENNNFISQSYSQLWHRSNCILKGLRKETISSNQPIIIILDQCHDFVFGCLELFNGRFCLSSLKIFLP